MSATATEATGQRGEPLDPVQLLEARLWVARLGDGDVHRWWRTDGILGADGAFVGPRVLPTTHITARARLAFALARHACAERYPEPGAMHLFQLDAATEEALDMLLVNRLADREYWSELALQMEALDAGSDPKIVLVEKGVVSKGEIGQVRQLPLGPRGRSVALPTPATLSEAVCLLAAGFVLSSTGQLVVPHLANTR